jgi:galactose-1-phosphate uridylyltransferase
MEFHRVTDEATFHSPLEDFAEVTETVEIRRDPLTGRTARVTDGAFAIAEDPDIDPVVSDDEGCFFCPDVVADATPTYADAFDVDRGSRGEATSFPNLNPYGAHSNVIALTETHFQPMEEFTRGQFADGLALAFEYIERVRGTDPDAGMASVNMNFLRSAGSSLVHPHLQTLADGHGTSEGRRLLEASRDYRDEHGRAYWDDLVDAERGGDRWIGETAGVDWLAPFAPQHHRQVLGVFDTGGLPDPDGDAVGGLAEGLTNVLGVYADDGLNAFNFALHLSNDDAMGPVFTIIARSVFDEYYWSDSTYFTMLHDEGVIDAAPEAYAADLRDEF